MHGENPYLPQSLSLPIRLEQERRRKRAGIAAVIPGLVLIALSVYAFTRGGAEILGIWAAACGLGLTLLGVTVIARSGRR